MNAINFESRRESAEFAIASSIELARRACAVIADAAQAHDLSMVKLLDSIGSADRARLLNLRDQIKPAAHQIRELVDIPANGPFSGNVAHPARLLQAVCLACVELRLGMADPVATYGHGGAPDDRDALEYAGIQFAAHVGREAQPLILNAAGALAGAMVCEAK